MSYFKPQMLFFTRYWKDSLMFPVLPRGIKPLHFLLLLPNDKVVTFLMFLACNSL